MAVWRTKAYETFGFESGAYSFRHGKAELFADLFAMAQGAVQAKDTDLLARIFGYAAWANGQNAEDLCSAADVSFFIPVFRNTELAAAASEHLPEPVASAKRRLVVPPSA